ncbi:DUF2690 domain-containing protein [Streptomyces sp. NPDC088253]|uniref:DUF2690 domain-containing protein n=1 Tax=Streptomyces sp. NPDC088253 TaxID=3365846 RepID=UPI00381C7BE4
MEAQQDGQESTPRHELAQLLRAWWKEDQDKITQKALARQLTLRGVKISQAMLSRYLTPTDPILARVDVIRAMHEILTRKPEELAAALNLHAKASQPSTTGAQPADKTTSAPVTAVARRKWPWLAVAALVVAGALWFIVPAAFKNDDAAATGRSSATPSPSGSAASSPSMSPIKCRSESCYGIDPEHSTCRDDTDTYYTGQGPGVLVELRFSPSCQAAWAKISGTSQGDVVRVTNNAGRTRHYTQQWGRDAHTTMVEALNPDDAKACARTSRGSVCATTPAEPSAAPRAVGSPARS